jgi:membrane complex biogenesis BtpA family protein
MADRRTSREGLQVVGMVQLRPLPGSARYTDEPLHSIVDAALAEVAILSECGFTGVQLQNMGDSPSSRRAGLETVAYMTTAAVEIRRSFPRLQLSILVNWDAEGSIAVADASSAHYVRVEHTWIGASVTSWGISQAQCHEATAFRSRIRSRVPILADVYEPHAVPLVEQPVDVVARAAVHEGGADGLFVTGRSFDESITWGEAIREVLPTVPLWLGGGATADNIAAARSLFDGVTVATSIKHGDMRNPVDPDLARDFVLAALAQEQ